MQPLQDDDTLAFLDPEITLVNEPLHPLMDPLGRGAVWRHLGHKRAALELSPMVKGRLYLFFGPYSNQVARLQTGGGSARGHDRRLFAATGEPLRQRLLGFRVRYLLLTDQSILSKVGEY
jgi:hypothetical protein